MTEARKCAGCGERERRWLENGKPRVNLDPILGLCVTCLTAYVKETRPTTTLPLDFDAKAAAAGEDRD